MSKPPAEGPVVGAVVNAIAIMRHLASHPEPSGVNAIARAVELSPSSCFNILKTLVREDLVEFDPRTKTYTTGPGAIALARRTADPASLFPMSRPLLEELAERYAATTALWRVTPSERLVVLGFAESASTTRIHMTVGQRLPMLVGAGGRCVAAALDLPPETLAREFAKLRWANPPTLEAYRRQVAEAKARGWGLDDGNFLSGVTTVAAPLGTAAGPPAYVISATVFRDQHPHEKLARLGADLVRCAAEIARRMGL